MSEKLSLNELSGYNELKTYYDKNITKPWNEWLMVEKVLKPGKQGMVGVMTDKEKNKKKFVFKISQYINYLVQHELCVMKALNEMSDFCPHFCKVFGGMLCEVNPNCRKIKNPFEDITKHPLEKEVLLMEYLKHSYKFYNYITAEEEEIPEDILYSIIKQTLIAISIAQRKKNFTHYDLHSNNIMLKKCDKDLVFLYILDEQNQFCVPTFGYYPVIIDFGFSYVKDMDDGPLWPTLGHTKVGFTSDRFDPIADPKLFLITVSAEMNEERGTKKAKLLRNITRNIFKPLKVDWSCGWDKGVKKSVSDYVLDVLQKTSKDTPLFAKYDYLCIDIIQTLIVLPIEKRDFQEINNTYKIFLKEFIKIEETIGSHFYSLYVLKGIVDSARIVRKDYNYETSRKHAIEYFQHSIYEILDSVCKYCRPKDVNYEVLLCSLLCFAKNMEGLLYEIMGKKIKEKYKQYEQLPVKTPEEIFSIIDINIEDDYVFNEKTTIMVQNCLNNTCYTMKLTKKEQEEINRIANISRGMKLYEIQKNNIH